MPCYETYDYGLDVIRGGSLDLISINGTTLRIFVLVLCSINGIG